MCQLNEKRDPAACQRSEENKQAINNQENEGRHGRFIQGDQGKCKLQTPVTIAVQLVSPHPGPLPLERENHRQSVGEAGIVRNSKARAWLFPGREPERRPPARRGGGVIVERAGPEAGVPMLWVRRTRRANRVGFPLSKRGSG